MRKSMVIIGITSFFMLNCESKATYENSSEEIEIEEVSNEDDSVFGMWSLNYYVDAFGEPTKKGYIQNYTGISGTFSNTATHNSRLNVTILISNDSSIYLQLYEYGNSNPVKASSYRGYEALVQDTEGERVKLRPSNNSDRLKFSPEDSNEIHKILMKGGEVKFKIHETKNKTTEYSFSIKEADMYDKAYAKLKES